MFQDQLEFTRTGYLNKEVTVVDTAPWKSI